MFGVRFWGVRGSIACSSPTHVKYGGNTSCLEVLADDHRFVLDAGTGIRQLSKQFLKSDIRDIYLLLSHTHWDHIDGFPFFRPAYQQNRQLRIYAGHLKNAGGVQKVFSQQMAEPVFPLPLDAMKAICEYNDFEAGDRFGVNSAVKVDTAPLNHPNGATGYRLQYQGKSICYVTDTEHVPGQPDQNILGLIEGADLVIYDSTYTEQEFPSHITWGHSTWNEGMRLCQMANVKRLVIFHHDPDHEDDFMDGIQAAAEAAWPGTIVAREQMLLTVE